MTPFFARILRLVILLLMLGGWATIVYVAGDPGTGWGRHWFTLAMAHAGLTYVGLLACYVLKDPLAWKQRLGRALINIAALLLAAVLVELPAAVGWVDYRLLLISESLGGTGPHNQQFDRDVVHRRPPHGRFIQRQAGDFVYGLAIPTSRRYTVDYHGDANGYRNLVDYRQADVVLLGDSFIEGYNVGQSEIVSVQLARRLHRDVCNLGMCDYGPFEELGALRKFGVKLHPRAVIWFFYEGNDLADIEKFQAITDNWDRCLAREKSFAYRSFFANAADPLMFMLNQLRWRESAFARRYEGRLLPEIPRGPDVTYFHSGPLRLGDHAAALVEVLKNILREGHGVCIANSAVLVVAYVPRKERVYRDLCTFSADSDVPRWELNDLSQQLGPWCEETGIKYLDLTPALHAAARQGRLAYLVDDAHWAADGHAVAAEELAQVLRETCGLDTKSGNGK